MLLELRHLRDHSIPVALCTTESWILTTASDAISPGCSVLLKCGIDLLIKGVLTQTKNGEQRPKRRDCGSSANTHDQRNSTDGPAACIVEDLKVHHSMAPPTKIDPLKLADTCCDDEQDGRLGQSREKGNDSVGR
jgi:hypothetical protein